MGCELGSTTGALTVPSFPTVPPLTLSLRAKAQSRYHSSWVAFGPGATVQGTETMSPLAFR